MQNSQSNLKRRRDVFLKRFQIASLDDLPDYEQVLAEIQRPKTASYLFTKDTYDETKDPEVLAAQEAQQEAMATISNANLDNSDNGNLEEGDSFEAETLVEDDDFELCDISEEELPEHLLGEKVDKIG